MTAQVTIPYLTIKGAAEAIAFYQKAFGAVEETRLPAQDGKRLMHASILINGGTIMMSDEFLEHSEHGAITAPSKEKPAGVAVAVNYDKPAELDAVFKRAVDAGCDGILEPQDMFWGARFAMLRDPFGHRWMLNAPLQK